MEIRSALYELHKALKRRPVLARNGQRMEVKGIHKVGKLPRSCQAGAVDAGKVHHQRQR